MVSDLNRLAREIIGGNQYLSLATADEKKGTWVCVLCYAYDEDFNFYFASTDSARHSKNTLVNKSVSFAVYDSRQNWGVGVGLQIEGIAEKVKDSELQKVTALYFYRKYPYGKVSGAFLEEFQKLLQKKVYSFYRITPVRVWMNNPNANVDERVKINLI